MILSDYNPDNPQAMACALNAIGAFRSRGPAHLASQISNLKYQQATAAARHWIRCARTIGFRGSVQTALSMQEGER